MCPAGEGFGRVFRNSMDFFGGLPEKRRASPAAKQNAVGRSKMVWEIEDLLKLID
jgi:hypothetical protein